MKVFVFISGGLTDVVLEAIQILEARGHEVIVPYFFKETSLNGGEFGNTPNIRGEGLEKCNAILYDLDGVRFGIEDITFAYSKEARFRGVKTLLLRHERNRGTPVSKQVENLGISYYSGRESLSELVGEFAKSLVETNERRINQEREK